MLKSDDHHISTFSKQKSKHFPIASFETVSKVSSLCAHTNFFFTTLKKYLCHSNFTPSQFKLLWNLLRTFVHKDSSKSEIFYLHERFSIYCCLQVSNDSKNLAWKEFSSQILTFMERLKRLFALP